MHKAKSICIIESSFCMYVHRDFINDVMTIFLGIVFCGDPIHQRITSQGATVQPPDSGMALYIPEQTLSDVDLHIHPCFSGPFELPDGYESASPAYLIQTSTKGKLHKAATVLIHHYARLENERDCEEMAFLSASPIPQHRDSKPVYVFTEIKDSQGVFKPKNSVGEIKLQHFCFCKIGRRRKIHPEIGGLSICLYIDNGHNYSDNYFSF